MLRSLHVKNLALIDEAEVEFGEGLNILSGETGAGKSIIIGSINLALGGKVQKEMLRENADAALVELIFEVKEENIKAALAAMDVSAEEVQMTGFCDDASIPSWAKGYAVSALNAGVVSGVSTAEGAAFRAGDLITLNEAAVVLNRLLRVTDVDLSDYDAQDAENAWCAQAVANLQSVSIIESGRFSADEMRSGVTRAQAAEMLSAAMTLRNDRNEKGGLLSGLFG